MQTPPDNQNVLRYGVHRSYRFEVAAIGVGWMALIIVGILAAVFFRSPLRGMISSSVGAACL